MNLKLILLIIMLFFIYGCGERNSIDVVKEYPFPINSSYTNSQAFNDRPLCAKITWESFEDSRGREIVEYTCVIKNSDIFYENKTSDVIKNLEKNYEKSISKIDDEISGNAKIEQIKHEISFHEKAIVEVPPIKRTV